MSSHTPHAAAASPEIERSAYNSAFHDLGLRMHWDEATYRALAPVPCERQRLQNYLRSQHPHLLRAYDDGFLADAILDAKRRRQAPLARCAPQSAPQINWADARWGEVGV
jgi:hypothetical protein